MNYNSRRTAATPMTDSTGVTYRVLSRECATRHCTQCDGTACLHGPLGPYKPGDPCMHHCHTPETGP